MSNRPEAPLFATVNITGVCNLQCKYCFYQPRLHQHMPRVSFEKVINELSDLKVFFVNLSGGEPFTHPEIESLLLFAHQKFQHVVTLTNGTILHPGHIETIARIVQQKDGFPIQISIDSIIPEVNSVTRSEVTRIQENIRILSEIGANIVIAMVITRFNATSLIESIIELSKFTSHFHIMNVQNTIVLQNTEELYMLEEEELARLWEEIKQVKQKYRLHIVTPDEKTEPELGCAYGAPCMAGFSHIVIDPSLKVRPCDRCVEAFVGDLNHQTIEEVWRNEVIERILTGSIPYCQRTRETINNSL